MGQGALSSPGKSTPTSKIPSEGCFMEKGRPKMAAEKARQQEPQPQLGHTEPLQDPMAHFSIDHQHPASLI